MEKIVNVDYIAILRETSGELVYEEVEIPQNKQLAEDLNKLYENGADCLELQERWQQDFPKVLPNLFYCYPSEYDSAFEDEKVFPYVEKADYLQQVNDFERDYRERHVAFPSEKIEEAKQEWIKQQAAHFQHRALNYLSAYAYYQKYQELKTDPSVKMLSLETGGWTGKIHHLSDDLKIELHTNLGYGQSSYFYESVEYRGMMLVPYSLYIGYYYAKMADLMRCTWSYEPARCNWGKALESARLVANLSKEDPERFVKDWVTEQVRATIEGLKAIDEEPARMLQQFKDTPNPDSRRYLYVRNMTLEERKTCEVLPDKFCFLLRAEKISDGLFLLDSMRQFAHMSLEIADGIEELISMNIHLYPELLQEMEAAQKEKKAQEQLIKKDSLLKDKAEAAFEELGQANFECRNLKSGNGYSWERRPLGSSEVSLARNLRAKYNNLRRTAAADPICANLLLPDAIPLAPNTYPTLAEFNALWACALSWRELRKQKQEDDTLLFKRLSGYYDSLVQCHDRIRPFID